ncbi:hypothetical protein Axy10_038 [Achromobacter phage vB_AxyP_19-32_Axy10]|uniref:Uncharacterized protein n=1 Tax=Achromobacter phage vB_AxyP_19-32_Axy10 TaxID=2591041 RepID=A0A514CU25_9CAUD|nr:hypothetical protein KMC59_gp80 [Achromobacter phage vB_AxyP_19-32_Axy10]QDH83983.1 hypothetical protein Axy10_038 [Achromobacter phage vB_AxyP_19-32_Axy10]
MTRRIDHWNGNRNEAFYSSHPTRLQEIRDRTNNQIPFNWKTRKCVCCKRSRSLTQFNGDSATCKRCPPEK